MARDLKNLIGPQIARIRAGASLSQEQFAAHCQSRGWDISRETLAKIESGVRCVTDVEVLHIAKALQVAVQDLFPINKQFLFRAKKAP
jgi:DNA-binding XRE family transcriptional regulator